ncbi:MULTISPECIES: LysR family transcriptional regulator [Pseudomonas]|jgi:DNA-binding transcriptional LysR family regulator|uniref:LysR family transcriptional regulator n=1 Tax=Pseudomonas TaxID=286 RepID=UPI000D6B52F6|nr:MULTISPECIES: LysR family transcriptional regulator [Pseudomonas]AXP04048.1 LysR family transcriptional regulator [Pseudomonas fluorescens]MCD9113647.1 LysR family transcriptional regulator [Pseudomonas bijieensis]PWJ31650.1 DNA-binding transcriptional LysR family regulator [Pseudomonas sp. 43mfcvi1.1]UQI29259.1 LysR family transcriptional regulator [Pseudomonas bijieensis]WLH60963.1 LysR family transcriptional regulator [Pseudomonas sp. FP2300]
MNWDDARVFLAVCRASTLRGAARALGVDQATVGRRITALEKSLSAALFLRTPDGYALTAVGEAALEAVEKMEHSALELERRIQGLDDRLIGNVRVATTDSLAIDFLIPAIARLHGRHPDVRVQLDASTQILSLVKREADIAVRNTRPDNPDLIARRIARWPVGLFASRAYVDAHGLPSPGSEFEGHDLVVYQPYLQGSKDFTLVCEPINRGRIVASLSSSLLVRRSIAAGIGVGEIPVYMGERDGLLRIWPERTRPLPYEVWLVTHADLRHTARVRAVIDEIVEVFALENE